MAKQKRNRREEEIDEVIVEQGTQAVESTQDWLEKNSKLILGLIAGLLLLIGAFLIFKYLVKEPKEKEAKAAIYKAEQQFARDSFALALENPGGGFDGLLDVIDNYSGTATSNLAKLYAGISYLNLGRFDDAISYLESHTPTGDYSPILKNGNLGDAYSEKGDYDTAMTYYNKATSAGDDALLTPYYLYKLGLLAKKQGDNTRALTAFQKIKTNYAASNEGTHIDVIIESISNS